MGIMRHHAIHQRRLQCELFFFIRQRTEAITIQTLKCHPYVYVEALNFACWDYCLDPVIVMISNQHMAAFHLFLLAYRPVCFGCLEHGFVAVPFQRC